MTSITPSPEMVERAARSDAAFDGRDFDRLGRVDRQRYLDRAQKSLTAALSCPDGFRLVPVEPTAEMVRCGEDALRKSGSGLSQLDGRKAADRIYRAMLAASPAPAVGDNAGWRPIETAPKEGTIVLGTWSDTWPDHPHVEAVYCCEGKWFYAYDGDTHHRAPTHWQPLPSTPSQDAPQPISQDQDRG